MIEVLEEELYLFNLLRHLFLKEPSSELIKGLQKIEMPEKVENHIDYGLNLIRKAIRKNSKRIPEWLEELAQEYARLFLGPKQPPAVPYASFYLSETKALMSEETIEVRKKYLEAGMAVKDLYRIPEDHIGIELEFIYELTKQILDWLNEGEQEMAAKFFEIRKNFIKDHMLKWVPLFAETLLENTKEDFYKGAAYILRGVIETF